MRTIVLGMLLVSMNFFMACSPQELESVLTNVLTSDELTPQEAGLGLKEALTQGVVKGSDLVSAFNGYYKNEAIKILFPPEAQKIEQELRKFGAGSLVDDMIEKVNHAAEDAAKEAKPIFKSAVQNMTFNDAMNILMGESNAATTYLKTNTSNALYGKFKPVITNALNKRKALDSWTKVVNKYNTIPFVQKMNPDLADHVTNKAMDGLFLMIEKEEQLIRKDPIARTTDLLKKVFAKQDNK